MILAARGTVLALAGSEAEDDADYATLAAAQAVICGLMLVFLAVFKLGFLANFLKVATPPH